MATGTNSIAPTAEQLKNKASETAAAVADKAKQTAAAIGSRADEATHAVGSGMKTLAETIRDKGPHEGFAGSAASSLAGHLESGGQYLQHEGIKGIAEDMTNLVRRNPIPALLLGVGLGFILARATMRR